MAVETFETQTNVSSLEAPTQVFRPIHYLGSKLRLLSEIGDAVNEVSSKDAFVCDLFSGSGVVSSYLGIERRVLAVDIQEYARVLASSVLLSRSVKRNDLAALLTTADDDDIGQKLLGAFEPLITYEAECVKRARDGKPEALADLIEIGSVVSASGSPGSSAQVSRTFAEVTDRLSKRKLTKVALVSQYYGGLYFNYHHAIQLDVLLSKAMALQRFCAFRPSMTSGACETTMTCDVFEAAMIMRTRAGRRSGCRLVSGSFKISSSGGRGDINAVARRR